MSSKALHDKEQHEQLSWIANKSIIIAGAGISGLSFAISLSKVWPAELASSKPKVTILERDSETDRIGREGYSLSLRTDDKRGGGIQVLDDLGLYEATRAVSTLSFDGHGSMVMWDSNWNEIIRMDSKRVANHTRRKLEGMRIRRNALQQVLATAAKDAGAEILWQSEAVDARPSAQNGKMEIVLSDGTVMECDLAIAGDGSKSKIRSKVRPQDRLDFAGPVLVTGTARFATREDIPNPLEKDWGLFLGGNGIGMFLSPVDEKSTLWSVSHVDSEPQEQLRHPLTSEEIEEILEDARAKAKLAGPRVRQLIDATDPTTLMKFNAMDRPPFRHTPDQHGSVVFIGDSNHAVSPFAGNGANMALIDGWDLASCLSSSSSLQECLQRYDDLVLPRTQSVLSQSRWNISIAHASGWKATLFWVLLKMLGLVFGTSGKHD